MKTLLLSAILSKPKTQVIKHNILTPIKKINNVI